MDESKEQVRGGPSDPPEAASAGGDRAKVHQGPKPRRRLATLYDAVAGRVSNEQALWHHGEAHTGVSRRPPRVIRHSTRSTTLAPVEVLFRRKGAPERYAEHDIYFSHERDLPRAGRGVLPPSDLLKTVHGYVGRFYGALARTQGPLGGGGRDIDERSLDETALLAFGILLEEAGRHLLGRHGGLVFTEGVPVASAASQGEEDEAPPRRELGDQDDLSYRRGGNKRRKVQREEET